MTDNITHPSLKQQLLGCGVSPADLHVLDNGALLWVGATRICGAPVFTKKRRMGSTDGSLCSLEGAFDRDTGEPLLDILVAHLGSLPGSVTPDVKPKSREVLIQEYLDSGKKVTAVGHLLSPTYPRETYISSLRLVRK